MAKLFALVFFAVLAYANAGFIANTASVAEARTGGNFAYNVKEGGAHAYAAPVAAVAPVAAYAAPIAAPVATYAAAAPLAYGAYGAYAAPYAYAHGLHPATGQYNHFYNNKAFLYDDGSYKGDYIYL